MGGSTQFAYLNTRVTMRARQLGDDARLEALLTADREQEAAILERGGLVPGDIKGKSLEQPFIQALLVDAHILISGLTKANRDAALFWIRRFEFNNLKCILRGRILGLPNQEVLAQLVDLGPFNKLPVDRLLRAHDANELLRLLEQTSYAGMARVARRVYEQQRELFTLDAAMDQRYFIGLNRHVNAVSRADRPLLQRLLGFVVDTVNLIWLLRFRFVYRQNPAEAYYILNPGGHYLGGHRLLELSQLNSRREVIEGLPQVLAGEMRDTRTISEMERRLEVMLRRMATGILERTAFNLARAIAYLLLRENDLLRMHAIIKGKRLKLEPELIRYAVGLPGGIPTPPTV